LWYLSGLTCTDLNFTEKANAQRFAAKHGIILVAPDTSPRGLGYPGETDSWDFGVGAGMYVDATQTPWKKGYQMYSYITQELPKIISQTVSQADLSRQSILGHSMGGHGALVITLRNPTLYKSVSAFAPICNPSRVPWGIKGFTAYLGADKETWKEYDATVLIKTYKGPQLQILIDQGEKDSFISTNLTPEVIVDAARSNSLIQLNLRIQSGYDHGYYFVTSFIEDHIDYHAKFLQQKS